MIVSHETKVPSLAVEMPEAKNAAMKVLIGEAQGWQDHVMRIIEVGEGGHTPKHTHPWPHINYMIEGRGKLYLDGEEQTVEPGSYAYVPAGREHQFRNTGSSLFRFICIVPKEGHK
jgi:quercetin dioxygenase-like cupin family protein